MNVAAKLVRRLVLTGCLSLLASRVAHAGMTAEERQTAIEETAGKAVELSAVFAGDSDIDKALLDAEFLRGWGNGEASTRSIYLLRVGQSLCRQKFYVEAESLKELLDGKGKDDLQQAQSQAAAFYGDQAYAKLEGDAWQTARAKAVDRYISDVCFTDVASYKAAIDSTFADPAERQKRWASLATSAVGAGRIDLSEAVLAQIEDPAAADIARTGTSYAYSYTLQHDLYLAMEPKFHAPTPGFYTSSAWIYFDVKRDPAKGAAATKQAAELVPALKTTDETTLSFVASVLFSIGEHNLKDLVPSVPALAELGEKVYLALPEDRRANEYVSKDYAYVLAAKGDYAGMRSLIEQNTGNNSKYIFAARALTTAYILGQTDAVTAFVNAELDADYKLTELCQLAIANKEDSRTYWSFMNQASRVAEDVKMRAVRGRPSDVNSDTDSRGQLVSKVSDYRRDRVWTIGFYLEALAWGRPGSDARPPSGGGKKRMGGSDSPPVADPMMMIVEFLKDFKEALDPQMEKESYKSYHSLGYQAERVAKIALERGRTDVAVVMMQLATSVGNGPYNLLRLTAEAACTNDSLLDAELLLINYSGDMEVAMSAYKNYIHLLAQAGKYPLAEKLVNGYPQVPTQANDQAFAQLDIADAMAVRGDAETAAEKFKAQLPHLAKRATLPTADNSAIARMVCNYFRASAYRGIAPTTLQAELDALPDKGLQALATLGMLEGYAGVPPDRNVFSGY